MGYRLVGVPFRRTGTLGWLLVLVSILHIGLLLLEQRLQLLLRELRDHLFW